MYLLDRIDATALPAFRRARRGIAAVPENRGVFASLSVAENLRLAARRARQTEERVWALFPRLRGAKPEIVATNCPAAGNSGCSGDTGRALMTDPRLLMLVNRRAGAAGAR